MEPFVRWFIRSSLVWLGIGVVLGLAMALAPGSTLGYRAAHMHANLLGFVSMMIFGVAYHVLPRFFARPLHSRAMAMTHLWVANAGLALMVGGFVARVHAPSHGSLAMQFGAGLSSIGAFLFIYNGWRTTAAPTAAVPPATGSGRRIPLPQAVK